MSGVPQRAKASSSTSRAWQASSVVATLCASTRRLATSATAVRYTKPCAIGMQVVSSAKTRLDRAIASLRSRYG